MKIPTGEELQVLIDNREDPAVSIYMPAYSKGDTEQNPTRLKNLIREAQERLVSLGHSISDTSAILDPAEQMLPDSQFWQHQDEGLALFLSTEFFRYYMIPYSVKESVVVAGRFHIKPLLSLFCDGGGFYLLAISQNHVRLLHCGKYHVRELALDKVPSSLDEALKYDEPEKQQQFHTTGQGGSVMFHGHGVGKDDSKMNILRYCQQVNSGLGEILRTEHEPLVIAAVDYLSAIYRQANTYPHLADEGIDGNPEGLSMEELQRRAWPIVQPYFERARTEALERYGEAVTKGLATNDVEHTVLAAYDGRVSTLFITEGVELWGNFEPEQRRITLYNGPENGAEDLLDIAAADTWTRGGVVHIMEPENVPGEAHIAALLRY